MTDTWTFGFRVAGPVQGGRGCLIDAAASFRRHAENRHDAGEAYLSAFWYGPDIRERIVPGDGSFSLKVAGYDGVCWSPYIWFDIDRAGDLPAAVRATRTLAGFALERYPALDDDGLLYFFSGSKGFHLGLPVGCLTAGPSARFHRVARRFAGGLAAGCGVTIDPAVYTKVQPFRAPNTRHPKTGLFKRRVTHAELTGLTADRIRELAAAPLAFDVPG